MRLHRWSAWAVGRLTWRVPLRVLLGMLRDMSVRWCDGRGVGRRFGGRLLFPGHDISVTARKCSHGVVGLLPGLRGGRFDVRRQRGQGRVYEGGSHAIRVGCIRGLRRALCQDYQRGEQCKAKCLPEKTYP